MPVLEALLQRLTSLLKRPRDGGNNDNLVAEVIDGLKHAFADAGFGPKVGISWKPGTGASGFHDEARWLVRQSEVEQPESAIERFACFVDSNRVQLHRVNVVWGLHPAEEIALDHDLKLVPLGNLPSSSARDPFLDRDPKSPLDHVRVRPKAALVHELWHGPIYRSVTDPEPEFTWDDKYFLDDLGLVLVLLAETPIIRVAAWYEAVNPDDPVMGGRGPMGWAGSADTGNPRARTEIPATSYDAVLARMLISSFRQVSTGDKQRLLVGLRRLNAARLAEMFSDMALETGIALEALLSQKDDPSDGISYRLRLRAAVLLESTSESRVKMMERMNRVYNLRSAAAHGSDIDGHWRGKDVVNVRGKKYKAHELQSVLQVGMHIATLVGREVLQERAFPEYDKLVVGGSLVSPEP